MADTRDKQWGAVQETYSEGQVANVLEQIGLDIESENEDHLRCLCPFHDNTDTSAFVVDKDLGLFNCFNPSCAAAGSLQELVRQVSKRSATSAALLIAKAKVSKVDFEAQLKRAAARPEEFTQFSQDTIDRLSTQFWKSTKAMDYMQNSRHFKPETLREFEVGYSSKTDLVTVPMHDPNGMPIGLIGRRPSTTDKVFKNSFSLPKSKTVFNLHRAKRASSTIILVEASFDTMRLFQTGYPNAGGLLGGTLSVQQIALLGRTFNHIIIATDDDEPKYEQYCRKCPATCEGHRPGLELGKKIATHLSDRRISWAAFEELKRFPTEPNPPYRQKWAKDYGDCSDAEIAKCVKGAVSNFEFTSWGLR